MRHVQDSTRKHFPRITRPGRRAPAPNLDELRALFVEQRIPVPEIAARWDVSTKVIYSRIQEYGLRPDWDADTLRRLYVDEGLSCEQIATRFEKSVSRIYQMLDRYDIPRRGMLDTLDGHRVRSSYEVAVDNWLSSHDLPHEYEAPIPNSTFRTDFLVQGIYIEIWGMVRNPRYQARKEEKIALYASLGLPLISLLRSDFPHLAPLNALLSHRIPPEPPA